MDPTSLPGPDAALPAAEGLQPPPGAAADAASPPTPTSSDNWLSRAMALWLQDADEHPGGIGQLSAR